MYEHLSYGPEELARVMRKTYDELIEFVTSAEFEVLMVELGALRDWERPQFVADVLMDDDELAKRGVRIPDGVLMQRSAFGDRRPTLFVVKKFLPEEFSDVWQNVNITFDNKFEDNTVSREPHLSWRPPLDVSRQASAMAAGANLEAI
jgi:hypothetical protein